MNFDMDNRILTLMICGGIMLLMYIAILALILADLWAGVTKASPYNKHNYGTFTEYAANIITFDKVNSLVKITRVGNTVDKFMQSKETLCYDVANMKMIYNT